MSKIKLSVAVLVWTMLAPCVHAEDVKSSALEQTLNCLKNQNCASGQTADGLAADQKALDAVGGNAASKQELYNISADILPFLLTQTAGDPSKLAAMMEKAQSDPEAFFNSLPADIQAKIHRASLTAERK